MGVGCEPTDRLLFVFILKCIVIIVPLMCYISISSREKVTHYVQGCRYFHGFEYFKLSKTNQRQQQSTSFLCDAFTLTSDLKGFTLSVGTNRPPGVSRIIAWVLLPWALLLLSWSPCLSRPDLLHKPLCLSLVRWKLSPCFSCSG